MSGNGCRNDGRFGPLVLAGRPLENRPDNAGNDQLHVAADRFTVAAFEFSSGAKRHMHAANNSLLLLLLLGTIAACNSVAISIKAIANRC